MSIRRIFWLLMAAFGILALAAGVLAAENPALQPAARSTSDVSTHEATHASEPDVTKPSLPPRALLRIGADGLRMGDLIQAFAFSPDGQSIVAADVNARRPRVVIFDVRTGRQIKQIVAPGNQQGRIQSFALSPDGTKLLWTELDGWVALWDLPGDRRLFHEKLLGREVNEVAFSPDGNLMAIAGGDVIHLRRVATPAEFVRDLTTRPDIAPGNLDAPKGADSILGRQRIGCLAFTPDGTRLVAGTAGSATLFIWRIQDGRLLRKVPDAHGKPLAESMNPRLNCVAVTPDGRRIMSVGQTTKPIRQTKLKHGPTNVTMSDVRFWDIESGTRVADFNGEEDYGFGQGALSRDGRRVAVGDFGQMRILDAATGRTERTIALPGSWGGRPGFSPDGTLVAIPIENTIALFEVSSGRRLHHDPSTPVGHVVSAAWSPSGDRLVTGHSDGFVRVWEAATGKLIWHKLLAAVIRRSGWNARPVFVSFSRDGKLAFAAGRRDDPVQFESGIVAIYDATSGRTVREISQREIRRAALEPEGRMVVVAASRGNGSDTHFIGVEAGTGRVRWANPPEALRAGFDSVAGMQSEENSPWFAVALRNGIVIRFNALTGHEQRRFLADWRTPAERKAGQPTEPDMWEAAFSVDLQTLVSSQMKWIHVWDVESGAIRRKIRHPHQHGCHLTLAPDGRTLATSDLLYADDLGEDTIRLYDILTGEQYFTLEPTQSRAIVMTFSPDGQGLFTGFDRGSGIVWDVRHERGTPRVRE